MATEWGVWNVEPPQPNHACAQDKRICCELGGGERGRRARDSVLCTDSERLCASCLQLLISLLFLGIGLSTAGLLCALYRCLPMSLPAGLLLRLLALPGSLPFTLLALLLCCKPSRLFEPLCLGLRVQESVGCE